MVFAWIKKHLPTEKQLERHKSLHWMSKWMKARPYLWKWTKHAVAGGVAVSLLVAFIPLPVEMILAALLAILFRVNLPIAILCTWLTNPITFIPANYLIYKTGQWLWQSNGNSYEVKNIHFYWHDLTRTGEELLTWLGSIGKFYLIGFPVVSIGSALCGYFIVYIIWTLYELIFRVKKKT